MSVSGTIEAAYRSRTGTVKTKKEGAFHLDGTIPHARCREGSIATIIVL